MTRLLLVEDNADNSDMLARRLRRRGYEVAVAADGQQGLQQAAELHPDLILMDISLPVMDGLEATRRIRSAVETQATPVIALTAHAMEGDRQQAMAAGCNEYHTKPVDFELLLQQIEQLLTSSRENQ